ncbi:unnamed protein product [Arctogadus glacialis]
MQMCGKTNVKSINQFIKHLWLHQLWQYPSARQLLEKNIRRWEKKKEGDFTRCIES